jgi:hypothetical protein
VRPLILVLIATVGLLGCESTSAPVPVYEHHVTAEMVTGAALAALDSDGRFNLEQPATTGPQVSLQVALAQSHDFALWVTNQILLRGVVEGERGGFWTDPHLLTNCRDAYFVHSQLGTTVADSVFDATQSFQRRYGAQWLIPMCGSQDDPQMTVQVAVNGNDIRFADGSPIQPYAALSSAWYARGVPLNWPDPLPVSAERAVRFVWETFGVRVTEVPQLYFRGDLPIGGSYNWYQIGSSRFCNRWRVVVENDVQVRGLNSAEPSTTGVLWIASVSCSQRDVDPIVHIPLPDQPAVARIDYFDESVSPSKRWVFEVPVMAPIRFEVGVRAF